VNGHNLAGRCEFSVALIVDSRIFVGYVAGNRGRLLRSRAVVRSRGNAEREAEVSQRLRRERATAKEKAVKWRKIGFAAAGILGLACVLGAIGLALILHVPPAPAIHIDPSAAQRLEQELKVAQSAASNGTPRTVRADETEINSIFKQQFYVATNGASGDGAAVVRDMKMTLTDDRLRLYVLTNIRGKDVALQLEGRLRAVNGFLDFDPISGKIGSLPLPRSSLKNAMEKTLATPEGLGMMRLPSNVRDLHVEDGKLVVVFK